MSIRPILRLTGVLCLAAHVLPAQVDVLGKATPASARAEAEASRWVSLPTYSPAASRAAFRACDRNGDDRLSVYEIRSCLDILEDLYDTRAFRQVDRNSDGYVDWSELDLRFRQKAERGLPLRVQPAHALRLSPEVDRVAQADRLRALALWRSMDADGNGTLLQSEVDRFLAASPLQAVKKAFERLDADRSGTIEVDELQPVGKWLRQTLPRAPATEDAAERLPDAYVGADQNLDGVISAPELAEVLRLQHPALVRWTAQIVADADRSGNGTLGRAELLAAQTTRTSAR